MAVPYGDGGDKILGTCHSISSIAVIEAVAKVLVVVNKASNVPRKFFAML